MTVRELLARIDAVELVEWQMMYELQPWGEQRDDLRVGLQTAAIAMMHPYRRRGQRFKAMDFMPDFEIKRELPVKPSQQTLLEQYWKFRDIADANNARLVAKNNK